MVCQIDGVWKTLLVLIVVLDRWGNALNDTKHHLDALLVSDGGEYYSTARPDDDVLFYEENPTVNTNKCPSLCICLDIYIDCSQRNLKTIPLAFPSYMHALDISSNQLNDVGAKSLSLLRNNSNLIRLNLHKNLLTAFPVLRGLRQLRFLSLASNSITTLSMEAMLALPNLQVLDLSNNRLTHLRANVFPQANSLSLLILNNNQIRTLDVQCFENLTQLSELRLNGNRISKLPKELFNNQKQLKLLELNRNQLGIIDGLTFLLLENLTVLKLKRNRITFLSDGAFWGLKNIGVLELDGNSLTKISKGWLYGLESLRTLSLAANLISIVEPDGWESCQNLHELDLSNNRLQEISRNMFKHLTQLERFVLKGNQISVISDGAFNNTPALQQLDLSNNKISWTIEDMIGAFVGLKRLVKFSLGANQVKSINRNAFVGLENLTRLDLSNNNIIGIQENAFAAMPNLQDLVLNTSSLLCDCNLQWFSEWLRNSKFVSAEARCAYPLHLRGQSLAKLSVTNFTCGDSPKPYLIEEPETKLTLKGGNVSLKCHAISSSPNSMHFKWKHDNVEIQNSIVMKQSKTEDGRQNEAISELQLFNLTHADAGKYQCIVENDFGTTYSAKAHISVLIYPSFIKTPQNMSISVGDTAKLECLAHGQPRPNIAWQKDGGHDFPAARERRMHMMMPTDDAFFIVNVKHDDAGVYSCTAQNPAGTIVVNATLTVLEKPSFSKPMENKDVMVGGTIVLQCMAGGIPRPSVTWSKDGGPLANTERHFFTAEDQLLVIVNTKMSDAGRYECKLNNELGEERGYTQLNVMPVPSNVLNDANMMGVIVITIACGAVGTSIIWVVIIYHTRKRISGNSMKSTKIHDNLGLNSGDISPTNLITNPALPGGNLVLIANDNNGSGIGGGTMGVTHGVTCVYIDNISEHSSCKDSGMGDSAKRSSDDFLPVDDFPNNANEETANLHETESPSSEDPLLQQSSTIQVTRPSNHERLGNISPNPLIH